MNLATTAQSTNSFLLKLETPLLTRLNDYQSKTDISKERIISIALQNFFDEVDEDLQDSITGEKAWNEYIASGKKSTSSAQLRKELGL